MTDGKSTEGTDDSSEEVNLRPGPQDRGGHGGMATREQEAREQRESEQDGED